MKRAILLTGSTGLLGSNLLKGILDEQHQWDLIWILVRGQDDRSAKKRVRAYLEKILVDVDSNFFDQRIKVKAIDLTKDNWGITFREWNQILELVETVIHSAAEVDFMADQQLLLQVNFWSIKNFLDIAHLLRKKISFYLISSFYATPNKKMLTENEIEYCEDDFNNFYEYSKFQAEGVVLRNSDPWIESFIYKVGALGPPINYRFNGRAQITIKLLSLLQKEMFPLLPVSSGSVLNILPADLAATIILDLIKMNLTEKKVIPVVADKWIRVADLVDRACRYFRVKPPKCISKDVYFSVENSSARKRLISPFVPYLNTEEKAFLKSISNFPLDYGCYAFDLDAYLSSLIKFCCKTNKVYG